MEFGVQIFGCLEECKKNPEAFFKTLSEAGYKQIEPCVLFDDPTEMMENAIKVGDVFMQKLSETIWKPDELPAYIKIMEKYGLKLSSVHIFTKDLNKISEQLIQTAKKNNITAYIVNCNQQTVASEYSQFARECSELSSKLRKEKIELWIHNNGAEIKAKTEYMGWQVPVLSAILDLCKKDQVGAQIDVGWVLYGGCDPVEYLESVKEYVRSIHFKDLKKDFATRKDGEIFACLGEGALKVKEILAWQPVDAGVTVLVDQDESDGDIMEDMVTSYKVLSKAGLR